jgi:hypothetical protein
MSASPKNLLPAKITCFKYNQHSCKEVGWILEGNIGKYAGGEWGNIGKYAWKGKGNSLREIWRGLIHGTSFHSIIALFI